MATGTVRVRRGFFGPVGWERVSWSGVIAGLVMAAATLGVAAGAENAENEDLARTMALTTFAIANLVFSFTARDELRSIFSLDTFNDRTFIVASLLSAAAIVLATELGFLQRILATVPLTGNQWLICIGAGLTVVIASELWKLAARRRHDEDPAAIAARANVRF